MHVSLIQVLLYSQELCQRDIQYERFSEIEILRYIFWFISSAFYSRIDVHVHGKLGEKYS